MTLGLTDNHQPRLPVHRTSEIAAADPEPPLHIIWTRDRCITNQRGLRVPRMRHFVGRNFDEELIQHTQDCARSPRQRNTPCLRQHAHPSAQHFHGPNQFHATSLGVLIEIAPRERNQRRDENHQVCGIGGQDSMIDLPARLWPQHFRKRHPWPSGGFHRSATEIFKHIVHDPPPIVQRGCFVAIRFPVVPSILRMRGLGKARTTDGLSIHLSIPVA